VHINIQTQIPTTLSSTSIPDVILLLSASTRLDSTRSDSTCTTLTPFSLASYANTSSQKPPVLAIQQNNTSFIILSHTSKDITANSAKSSPQQYSFAQLHTVTNPTRRTKNHIDSAGRSYRKAIRWTWTMKQEMGSIKSDLITRFFRNIRKDKTRTRKRNDNDGQQKKTIYHDQAL
jgi:hypothetical protein